MDNATIKLYKDGNDIIVVFKDASDELVDVIRKALDIHTAPSLIPDLEAPPECLEEPLDLSNVNLFTPVEKVKTFSSFIGIMIDAKTVSIDEQTKTALREYYDSHNKVLADVISTLEIERVKGFVVSCYQLRDDFEMAFRNSAYSTIKDFVESIPEDNLRNEAREIGKTIVSFFEATE